MAPVPIHREVYLAERQGLACPTEWAGVRCYSRFAGNLGTIDGFGHTIRTIKLLLLSIFVC